jgi:hypothetical protein
LVRRIAVSNRLLEIGRIPLIPDPAVAVRAGAVFAEALARADRVIRYKNAFFEPPARLWNALRRFGEMLERATYMRDLSVMGDRELEMRGVRRDQIGDLFFKKHLGDFRNRPANVGAGDGER